MYHNECVVMFGRRVLITECNNNNIRNASSRKCVLSAKVKISVEQSTGKVKTVFILYWLNW